MFNDALEHSRAGAGQTGRICWTRRGVLGIARGIAIPEDIDTRALLPIGVNVGMEGLLDISAIEVNDGAWRRVVSRVDYAELLKKSARL